MITDIIPLPNRFIGTSSVFSTKLPYIDDVDLATMVEPSEALPVFGYGRDIPLSLFRNNVIKKYKMLERLDDRIIESIFLSQIEFDINHLDNVIQSDDLGVYKIQTKSVALDGIRGRTFKNIKGISDFITDYLMNENNPFYSHVTDLDYVRDNRIALNAYQFAMANTVIPCPDYAIPNPSAYDNVDDSQFNMIKHYIHNLCQGNGAFTLSRLDQQITDGYLYDSDPIGGNWEMYRLIEYINSLVISNLEISVTRNYTSMPSVSISFDSVYSAFDSNLDTFIVETINNDMQYLVYHVTRTKFMEYPWTKIVIRKLWSEEIFIDVYCSIEGRSTEIVHVSYIDLIAFILGTIGLY